MATNVHNSFDKSVKIPALSAEIFQMFEVKRGKLSYAAYWDDKNIKTFTKDYNDIWHRMTDIYMVFINLSKGGLKKPRGR